MSRIREVVIIGSARSEYTAALYVARTQLKSRGCSATRSS